MTKEQFENNEKPMAVVISVFPNNPKATKISYVDWEQKNSFHREMEVDMPNAFHYSRFNKQGMKQHKKRFGI